MKNKVVLLYRGEMIEFCCLNALKEWVEDNDRAISVDICEDCQKKLEVGNEEI
jgi:hypothetical protein